MRHRTDVPSTPGRQPTLDSESCNLRIRDLNREMRSLSRQIGLKRRNNEDAQELLECMRILSKERKALERALKLKRAASLVAAAGEDCAALIEQDGAVAPPVYAYTVTCTEPLELGCDTVTQNEWDVYVVRHPRASQYHLYCWRRIIEKSFGHSTHYLTARSADGALAGILPQVLINSKLFGRYFVSLPFVNYGGALGDNSVVESALMNMAAGLARKLGCSHVEFRDTVRRDGWPLRSDKVLMQLALPSNPQQLWKSFSSKLRAQISHAGRERPAATIGGAELLPDFYSVFAHNMHDLGTPVYSRKFFQTICEQATSVRIVLVRLNNKPVSAGVLLRHRDMLEIPWASTLRSVNPLAINMYLYWTVLQYAIDSGHSLFDFGRSTVDSGTYKFKKQWGASPVPLYWHYWLPEGAAIPRLSPDNPKYKVAIAIWKRLPLQLANRLGPRIVRSLP
jgi:serine/alanine adding enzyme